MNKTDIPIANQCDADWSSMTGDGRRRFCDSCRKHVHDLSSMTSDDALLLLRATPTEQLCVRYIHNDAGAILFSNDERRAWKPELTREFIVPASALKRARRAALTLAAAVPLVMNACASTGGASKQPTSCEVQQWGNMPAEQAGMQSQPSAQTQVQAQGGPGLLPPSPAPSGWVPAGSVRPAGWPPMIPFTPGMLVPPDMKKMFDIAASNAPGAASSPASENRSVTVPPASDK